MAEKDFNDWPIIKEIGDAIDMASGAEPYQQAARTQRDGLKDARKIIQDAYGQAMGELEPLKKGGMEDFNNLRAKVNSGYYNTPFPGSYQSPSFPTQGFNPTWNPATQSYNSGYQPWQMPTPAPLQIPGLPGWSPPKPQAPAGPQPMTRPNAAPRETMGDLVPMMEQGIRNVTYQNLPGEVPRGMPISPMEEVINRGKPPDPMKPFLPSGAMTMQEWMEMNSSTQPGSLPYKGSGPFMPQYGYPGFAPQQGAYPGFSQGVM